MKSLKTYLYQEIKKVTQDMFNDLRMNNINTNLKKEELNILEQKKYTEIYNRYKDNLITIQNLAMQQYGYDDNFDKIFAVTVFNVVTECSNAISND